MKKVISILIAAALVIGLSACAKSAVQEETPANRLEEIRARGYIEVVMEPAFAPFEFIDSSKTGDEQYVGLDVEIAKYIAEKLGVELRIVPLEFSAVQAGITENKYDMAISALAYTPVRAENMTMSKGYYFSADSMGYGFLVREEDRDRYTTVESFADAVVVTQSASIQEGYVNDQIPAYKEFKLVSSMTDGFLMVQEGKADACACDIGNGELYAQANGGLTTTSFRFTVDETTQGTRVCVPLGEEELIAVVNECIDELRAQGRIDGWYEEYSAYAADLGLSAG